MKKISSASKPCSARNSALRWTRNKASPGPRSNEPWLCLFFEHVVDLPHDPVGPTAPRPQPPVRCDSPGKDYTRNPQGARRSYSKKLAQFNY
jgi:hypothetical protein